MHSHERLLVQEMVANNKILKQEKGQNHLAIGGIAANLLLGEGEVVRGGRWYRWIGRC